MGTAAVFLVETPNGNLWKPCMAMTHDGFPMNLRWIAESFTRHQRKFGITNTQAREFYCVKRLFDAIETETKGDIFHEENWRNAEWVSHSAIWRPAKKTLELYEGSLECHVRTQLLRAGKWTTTYLDETADQALYTEHCA